jgi:Aminotransferase class-III
VTLLGKALSGGFYPVSAVLSSNAVLGTLKPGQPGSTFGGNPLACVVARAALRVLVEEGMIENAAAEGARFLDGLRSIRSNIIREVRGGVGRYRPPPLDSVKPQPKGRRQRAGARSDFAAIAESAKSIGTRTDLSEGVAAIPSIAVINISRQNWCHTAVEAAMPRKPG